MDVWFMKGFLMTSCTSSAWSKHSNVIVLNSETILRRLSDDSEPEECFDHTDDTIVITQIRP